MAHWKTAATVLCLAVISGGAILWPAYQHKAMQRKHAEAARLIRARAEHGDTDAQYRLGSIYYYGDGGPQDYVEAIRWYLKSASQGSAKAQYAVAYCYLHGHGVSPDSAEAIRWLRKAAAQGDPEAQQYLGNAYRWGQGVPQNDAEAARWYRKAAERGDAAAQLYLSHAYRLGQGVPLDRIQAARWFLKVAGQIALRLGWTTFVALLLFLVVLVVPERRWRRAGWLPWALSSVAGAAYLLHLLSASSGTGWGRVLMIVFFATFSVLNALTAVWGALSERKHGVGPGQPPPIPEGSTGSPA